MRLTQTFIAALALPSKGQKFYRDDHLKGFGLRVTAGGSKSFIVEKRIDGRMRRKTIGAANVLTVQQARSEAQQFLAKIATGIDPIASEKEQLSRRITLREVFDTYLKVRKGLKPNTIHDYQRLMNEAFKDWWNRPLDYISRDAVAGRHRKLGQRSPSRANNAMRLLRALFNFAHGQYEDAEGRGLFPDNPVSRLSHTRAWYPIPRKSTIIKCSSLPAWYEAVTTLKRDRCNEQAVTAADFLLLLLFTGLRRSEGLKLRWSDIDFSDKTLTVTDTKNKMPLTLPLPDNLYRLLNVRAAAASSEFVFPGPGEFGHLVDPRKHIVNVIRISGVKFTLHDLRRTFITIAESLDIPVYAIKALVNHKMPNDFRV